MESNVWQVFSALPSGEFGRNGPAVLTAVLYQIASAKRILTDLLLSTS